MIRDKLFFRPSIAPALKRIAFGNETVEPAKRQPPDDFVLALALLAHRPDLDDAFYLNLAVAAVDQPQAALLAEDTLHGIAGLPVHHPVYRVHTWELWNALWSWLTGVPVIAMFHWVSASLAAALVPLACQKESSRSSFPRRVLPCKRALLLS